MARIQDKERCILVIKMYNGNYLAESNNIGHEIINLFRADNGKHYIYALPAGYLGKERDGKVTDILLVQNIGNNMLKVLACINNISSDQHIAQWKGRSIEELQKYVCNHAITQKIIYNGKPIGEIFNSNMYNGQIDNHSIFYTFEVESDQYRKPIHPMYLIKKDVEGSIAKERNNNCELGNIKFFSISNTKFHQTAYYTPSTNSEDFSTICGIIDNISHWEKSDTASKVTATSKNYKNRRSFLSICRKEYDELAYSNMLAYYLSKSQVLLQKFVNEVLGLSLKGPFQIRREYKNIDILIENTESSIIIENKIKSDINGKSEDKKHSQLDRYVSTLNSQLDDKSEFSYRELNNIYGFVLHPNYTNIDIERYREDNQAQMDRYYTNNKKNIITYGLLLDFFKNNKVKDKYYDEFLRALSIHAKENDTLIEDIMLERFIAMTN